MARLVAIGIFGGTFDPPHYGHLVLAEQARDQLNLKRILWVPAGDPPHKQGQPLSSSKDRVAMVERAIAGNNAFELSRIDLDRAGPHYSVDMVRLIAGQNPDEETYFLIGGDSLQNLTSWHKPAELIQQVTLAIMLRSIDAIDLVSLEKQIPGLESRIKFLDVPVVGISSEHIRARIRSNHSVRYQLPDAVIDYIHSCNVYVSSVE